MNIMGDGAAAALHLCAYFDLGLQFGESFAGLRQLL